jgi:hypothetical protein
MPNGERSARFDKAPAKGSKTAPLSPGAYPWRAKAGIGLVMLMAVLAMGTLVGYRSVLQKQAVVVIDERRFAGLRTLLPTRGIVGYLSDSGGSQESVRRYYLTQYSLAPVVVAPDSNREMVVANFSSPSAIVRLADAQGLTVEKDFGNGVALLRRRPR